jgi:hypothetical protein
VTGVADRTRETEATSNTARPTVASSHPIGLAYARNCVLDPGADQDSSSRLAVHCEIPFEAQASPWRVRANELRKLDCEASSLAEWRPARHQTAKGDAVSDRPVLSMHSARTLAESPIARYSMYGPTI